jgi:hypothetical protein
MAELETIEKLLGNYKLGAPRKIKGQLGRWYLAINNIPEQRVFNGLPPLDNPSGIYIPDGDMVKKAEDHIDYEMVYEIIFAPEFDLVLEEGSNNFIKVPPIVNVGDIVLAKGQAWKCFVEPVVWALQRDNFIAMIRTAEERKGLTQP